MGMVTPTMDATFRREQTAEVEESREDHPKQFSSLELTATMGELASYLNEFDRGNVTGEELFAKLVHTAAMMQRAGTEGIGDIEFDYPKDYPA